MPRQTLALFVLLLLTAALIACGGGNSTLTQNTPTPPAPGTVDVIVSDDATQDWATIGVKVLSISLNPSGGGQAVTIYTAPSPAPFINLVQLDQLGEIIGNASVPAGTYVSANVTISANPADVLLVASADPTSGFPLAPGTQVASSQIQVQGAAGTPPTVTVPVNFVSNLVVTSNQSNQLDLEFDLGHPAFIVQHVSPAGTFWAINFKGPLRHHPIWDISKLVLRHMYGQVTAVASDNSSITINRVFPVMPPTNPETAISSSISRQILVDSSSGTIFYDLDGKTRTVITSFSQIPGGASSLVNKYVRVSARYQQNGTLVAVRIWASTSFNKVWLSPEGHVSHVDTSANTLTVLNEDGTPMSISIVDSTPFSTDGTHFLFHQKQIGAGTGFLGNLHRGFKVHVNVVDPLASSLVAESVDIEIARFSGSISSPNQTSFLYTHRFADDGTYPSDDYVNFQLDYIAASTPNGYDNNGNVIDGFKWWYFAYPTSTLDFGANAISDFVATTNGAVNFGGTVGTLPVWGGSYANWDTASPTNWSAFWTVIMPTPAPLGTVSTAASTNSGGASFGMTVSGGTNPVTVNLSNVSGKATLVYQVDKTGGIITVTPQDITNSTTLNNVVSHLGVASLVKVYGVPKADGSIGAYVLFYFTGATPTV